MNSNSRPKTNIALSCKLLAALAGSLACAEHAHAQNMLWNGGSGSWSLPANWTPNNVPDNTGETATIAAPGAYAVSFDASRAIGGLTISNSQAVLNIVNSVALGNSGTLTNDGTIVVNQTGAGSATVWQAISSQAWNGSGAIVLNASSNLDTAQITWNGGGEVITQATTHTLRGTGRLITSFVNNGTINADSNGNILRFTNNGKINNNLMTATGGGILDVNTSVDQTGGGRINANGGSVRFSGASVTGGSINNLGGGSITDISSLDLVGVTTSGAIDVANSCTLRTYNTLANNGVITINNAAGGSATVLQLGNSTDLSGSGSISLNASSNTDTAQITWNGGGEVLTQAATHTIRGTGRIISSLTNNGNVTADIAGKFLRLTNNAKVNNNLMTSTGGAILEISCAIPQSASGQIRALNGSVYHTGSAVTGGLISASGTGLQYITGTSRWNSVSMTGPTAVEVGVTLQFSSAFTNNGTITVNRTAGGAGTALQIVDSLGFSGTGAIALNASSNLDTATITYNGGGEVLTLGNNQTVRGTGRVFVNTINNGLINADVSARTLQLLSQPKTNNTTIKATNGGTLSILNIGVSQAPGAQVLADGGNTDFSGATINGGNVIAQAGGRSVISNTSRFNGVTTSGPLDINYSITLQFDGGLTNNGVITVNSQAGGSGTGLQVMNSESLSGSGTVFLNATSNLATAYITYNGGGEVMTQAATHTIRGTGRIYVNTVNNGLISADITGKTLELTSQPKANNTTIRAINGGTLLINGIGVTQAANAQILADNASTVFTNCSVTGGQVNAINSGVGTLAGTATFSGVTTTGPLNVPSDSNLRTTSNLVNNGVITINSNSGGSGTYFQVLNSESLSGSGHLVLSATSNLDTAQVTWNGGGEVLTQAAGHTIRGTGRVYTSIINNGLVDANIPSRTLELTSAAKTNNATMRATNGGTLALTSVSLAQAPAGQLLADASTVSITNSVVSGGQINAANSGVISASGTDTVSNLAFSGTVNVPSGSNLRFNGGVTNNGTITINSNIGGSATYLQVLASQTLTGTGALYLNSTSNFDTAQITYSGGGEVLTNDLHHTIGGKGRIYCRTVNNGIISPGRPSAPIGQLDLRAAANLTFGPDSQFICNIAGSGDANADRITGDRNIVLDGTLTIRPVAPYTGNRGDEWTIISGASVSGTFFGIDGPPAVNGVGYKVEYFPNRVVLMAVCYADVNNDGGIDGSDVSAFFDLWEAGDPVSDLNNDGGVDGADVEIFFQYWEDGGC